MSDERPDVSDETKKIMIEDAQDLIVALWKLIQTYDNDNKEFEYRGDVIMNAMVCVVGNLLYQTTIEGRLGDLCSIFYVRVLEKIKSLLEMEDEEGECERNGDDVKT